MGGSVTIRDVARLAGVSPATVSRVLSGSGHPVREATRRRVLEAAERLAYYPNHLARSLLRRQTGVVGLLVPDVSNPYYGAILRGVEDVAHQHGLTVMLCNTDRDPAKQRRYLRTLLEYRVDGVVVAGGTVTPEDLRMVDRRVPLVAVGRHPADVPCVRVDNVKAGRQACRHLLELGHRQVGCLAGPPASLTSRDRVQGYREALRQAGVQPREEWVVWSEFTAQGGYRAARELLSRCRVTAVVAGNDQMALGAVRALWELGLRVPRDVSVVGFDDTAVAAVSVPALTTVAVPTYELGRRTLELLLGLRTGRCPRPLVLSTELRVRESTAPPRAVGRTGAGQTLEREGRGSGCRHP